MILCNGSAPLRLSGLRFRPGVPSPPLPVPSMQRSLEGKRLLVVCSRSDKHAAVLRLQSTQPKNRRIYTPLTGSSAWTEPAAEGKEPQAGNIGPKDGEGLNRYKGNSRQEMLNLRKNSDKINASINF